MYAQKLSSVTSKKSPRENKVNQSRPVFQNRKEDFPPLKQTQKLPSNIWGNPTASTSAETGIPMDSSPLGMLAELKQLFATLDLANICEKVKLFLENMKRAPDAMSKISAIASFVFSFIG